MYPILLNRIERIATEILKCDFDRDGSALLSLVSNYVLKFLNNALHLCLIKHSIPNLQTKYRQFKSLNVSKRYLGHSGI